MHSSRVLRKVVHVDFTMFPVSVPAWKWSTNSHTRNKNSRFGLFKGTKIEHFTFLLLLTGRRAVDTITLFTQDRNKQGHFQDQKTMRFNLFPNNNDHVMVLAEAAAAECEPAATSLWLLLVWPVPVASNSFYSRAPRDYAAGFQTTYFA